jgi:hypothetical protein
VGVQSPHMTLKQVILYNHQAEIQATINSVVGHQALLLRRLDHSRQRGVTASDVALESDRFNYSVTSAV